MNKLLLVDNYDSFTYNLAQILKEHGGFELDIIKHDQLDIAQVSNYNKILFSPGPGLPKDHPVMFEILEKYGETKSILGVCLGHQVIAEYYGGELYNLPHVVHGITKKCKIYATADYLFRGLVSSIEVGLYHSWAVKADCFPEKNLEVTMLSEENVIMALRHRDFDIRGIQFHPESIMTASGKQMLNNWLNY